MTTPCSDLVVPDDLALDQMRLRLEAHMKVAEGGSEQLTRTYWDSFDWRVHAAGGLLSQESVVTSVKGQECSSILVWRDLDNGEERCRERLTRDPGMTADLPPGALRDALVPVLEMRTLLPLVSIHSQVTTLNLLNEDDKTVVRLQFTDNRFTSPDNELEGPVGKRLCLVPVRGYAEEFDQVSALLSGELGLSRASGRQFEEALAAVGRTPEDYSSKLRFRLDPSERADAATKHIVQGLLNTLKANIDGTRANLDSEFLHDLRVACRRTRSALTQIKGVFPQEIVDNYKQRFAWLQQVTGPVRDLDVYLLEFDGYQLSLPERMRSHLEPVRDFLESHYQEEQQAMVRKLKSPPFNKLLRDWQRFIEAPVPTNPGIANAPIPVRELADARIWKMLRRVRKEGRAIQADSHSEELHELRKSCKKLRYLMEFFQSLYPGHEIKGLIKTLKVLLDNLGNFQDLAVQADKLRDMAVQMAKAKQADVDTLLAMGTLVGGLLERQQRARVEFAEIFAGFDSKPNRELYRDLFKSAQEDTA